jgi:hypothetical protein
MEENTQKSAIGGDVSRSMRLLSCHQRGKRRAYGELKPFAKLHRIVVGAETAFYLNYKSTTDVQFVTLLNIRCVHWAYGTFVILKNWAFVRKPSRIRGLQSGNQRFPSLVHLASTHRSVKNRHHTYNTPLFPEMSTWKLCIF